MAKTINAFPRAGRQAHQWSGTTLYFCHTHEGYAWLLFVNYGALVVVAGICDYVPNSIEPWSTCEGGCQNWGGIYQAYAWVQVRKICIYQGYACVA